MNLGELKKQIANLPDETEVWSWNDRNGYWERYTDFRVGLQHPKYEEAIFLSQEHFEDELNDCKEDFKVSVELMKKVVIIG